MEIDAAAHWAAAYSQREPEQLSWYQREPVRSLALIAEAELGPEAAILDVGGGASNLAARLIGHGYRDVTVVDISPVALQLAREQAGEVAGRIEWIEADVRHHRFARQYDLWHDRAVFHFMVSDEDRDAYVATLRATLRPGGHLVMGVFGPYGPERCSGLPTACYDLLGLRAALGSGFEEVSSLLEVHRTPDGREQEFLYAHLLRGEPAGG